MRRIVSKRLKNYVDEKFSFLSGQPVYRLAHVGSSTIVLAETCRRKAYKQIKKAYKRRAKNND